MHAGAAAAGAVAKVVYWLAMAVKVWWGPWYETGYKEQLDVMVGDLINPSDSASAQSMKLIRQVATTTGLFATLLFGFLVSHVLQGLPAGPLGLAFWAAGTAAFAAMAAAFTRNDAIALHTKLHLKRGIKHHDEKSMDAWLKDRPQDKNTKGLCCSGACAKRCLLLSHIMLSGCLISLPAVDKALFPYTWEFAAAGIVWFVLCMLCAPAKKF